MEIDPRWVSVAADVMDEFYWRDLDVRRARERSLASRLASVAEMELADLRAAEALSERTRQMVDMVGDEDE